MAEDEFQDLMIETGIDTLLKYLSKYNEGSVSEISTNIGVSEDRIKEWAKDLEEEGMVEIDYSLKEGMILTYTEDNVEEIKNQVEILNQQIEDNSTKLKKAVQKRDEKLKETRKELQEIINLFENLESEERKIESQIKQIEDLEKTIEEEIGYEGPLSREDVHKIEQINEVIQKIPHQDLNKIEYDKTSLESSLKTKSKLKKVLNQLDDPVDVS
jgi:predicted ArsR family transcriptional regulator